ncbi:peptidoglycan-binding protein [Nostoc sp.]|uniref:peptidoglycan-binding protein n=1 Tax=Nostoc sp. TaxID=1180 RepID=UPI0035934211
MATLQNVVTNNLQIPYGDIATSQLGVDTELCREIQQILASNNFYHFTVDGDYGSITRDALRDFKEEYALTGGDILGPTTAQFLLRLDTLSPSGDGDNNFGTRDGTVKAIIRECRMHGLTLDSQIAYVLATVEHETANSFKPVRESFYLREPAAERHRRTLRYYPYYGRGFVQLTLKSNYQKYSAILREDLVTLPNGPDIVMRPNVSLFILVHGMATGQFTGKRLGQYVSGTRTDFFNARRVVNDTDRAEHIAGIARRWLSRLDSFESATPLENPVDTGTGFSDLESTKLSELEILLFSKTMSS